MENGDAVKVRLVLSDVWKDNLMELTTDQLLTIRRTLRSLKFGQLTIDVSDGQIVEIGRRMQTRHLKRRRVWKTDKNRSEPRDDLTGAHCEDE